MTRASIALDRLHRHGAFVYLRRQRGIAQAVYLGDRREQRRLELRRNAYADLVTFELNCIEGRLQAQKRHAVSLGAPRKKSWKK